MFHLPLKMQEALVFVSYSKMGKKRFWLTQMLALFASFGRSETFLLGSGSHFNFLFKSRCRRAFAALEACCGNPTDSSGWYVWKLRALCSLLFSGAFKGVIYLCLLPFNLSFHSSEGEMSFAYNNSTLTKHNKYSPCTLLTADSTRVSLQLLLFMK